MMRAYEFQQVDVFTDRMFGGNPLAVFTDGRDLSDDEMQAIALEMNLSETTFVLPPDNANHVARIRIFTPRAELPFAGHPTVGTAWVLARLGRIPANVSRATLELGIGPVGVTLEGPPGDPRFIWMHQKAAEFGEIIEDRDAIASALGSTAADLAPDLPVQFVSTGFPFLYVPFVSEVAVDRATLSGRGFADAPVEAGGAFLFHSAPGSNRAYSRMIATIGGAIWEDPATGSASGPLGGYLVHYGHATGEGVVEITSEQGTKMGRQSFVHLRVSVDNGQPGAIDVGGSVVPVIKGVLEIPG